MALQRRRGVKLLHTGGRQVVWEHLSVTSSSDQGSLEAVLAAQSVVKQSQRNRRCFKSVPITIIRSFKLERITNRKIRGPFPKTLTRYRPIPRSFNASKVVSIKKWIWANIRKYLLMERTSLKLINFYLTHLSHMSSSIKRISRSKQIPNNLTPITLPWLNLYHSTNHGTNLTSQNQKRKTSWFLSLTPISMSRTMKTVVENAKCATSLKSNILDKKAKTLSKNAALIFSELVYKTAKQHHSMMIKRRLIGLSQRFLRPRLRRVLVHSRTNLWIHPLRPRKMIIQTCIVRTIQQN